jgi:hypothetical protein
MKVLLIAGAGTSVELGVPGMREMAEELQRHLGEHSLDPNVLSQLAHQLEDTGYDLESLIEELDIVTRAVAAGKKWGTTTPDPMTQGMRSMLEEAEWLVSHLCERVDRKRATLLWGPAMTGLDSHAWTIATTNYDRAIELCATSLGVPIFDGFQTPMEHEYSEWIGFNRGANAELLKLHGSTDWYHDDVRKVWKLRHAMPLFGDLRISAGAADELVLRSAAVLPSQEKRKNERPYPELNQQLRNQAADAEVAFLVGTSLRDPDLRDVAEACATRIPTYYVSRSGRAAVPGSIVVRQSASVFLTSTLPAVIATDVDSTDIEDCVSPILDAWAEVADAALPAKTRAGAIESLCTARIRIPLTTLRTLLDDPNDLIRLYALGLVADCHDPPAALEMAKTSAIDRPTEEFQQEVEHLRDLLDLSNA